jgi:hypothetical protein
MVFNVTFSYIIVVSLIAFAQLLKCEVLKAKLKIGETNIKLKVNNNNKQFKRKTTTTTSNNQIR